MKKRKVYNNQDFKAGDIVRSHTPVPGNDPDMIFIVVQAYYDKELPMVELVKFSRELNYYFTVKKWFIHDLERVPNVSLELEKEIEEFLKRKPGNLLVSRLLKS
ncbi:hypothetical protein [Sphingobacterium pedocola]|uniref:Uncharacterized protein n=1 Tax=Sphingobacterium pedocola TaxID=2082722 RepID=A0ABR9T7D5_9SPHI|nr:hypothetical protein [Sphingobacterium pedocola]MBE8721263.1 hypothetical protein [Sphingobacterium pedocola]